MYGKENLKLIKNIGGNHITFGSDVLSKILALV